MASHLKGSQKGLSIKIESFLPYTFSFTQKLQSDRGSNDPSKGLAGAVTKAVIYKTKCIYTSKLFDSLNKKI
jgi:hypothetical protein